MIEVLRRQRRLFGLLCGVFGLNIFNLIYALVEKRWFIAAVAAVIASVMGIGAWVVDGQGRDLEDELDRRMKWPLN